MYKMGIPLDAPLSKLFPGLFDIPRPVTTFDTPVIVAASMLSIYDSPMLPIVKERLAPGRPGTPGNRKSKIFQAIGGLPVIRMIVATKPSEYYKALWAPCSTTTTWIGSLDYQDTLQHLLQLYETTGFGDARAEADTPPNTLITLMEVVSLYAEGKLRCRLEAKDVASDLVSVDPEMKLIDAMKMMCEKRIRRLFLSGKSGEFISDRHILAFLFSPNGLKAARDKPESWTDVSLSEIRGMKATTVSPHAAVQDIGSLTIKGHDVLVLEDGAHVLSRWDLVMKPWKLQKLTLSL